MTLATDIADDMSFMDGYTAMTLAPKPGSSTVSGYGISGPVSQRQVALLGGLPLGPSDLSVTLQASTFSGTVPKDNDKLTIGSTVYTLLGVETLVLGTTYRAVARREA